MTEDLPGSRATAMDAAATAHLMDPAAITGILNATDRSRDGLDRVFSLVYSELKPIARRMLADSRHQTLSPTVMVHEAYVKLIGSESLTVEGRKHFYALCARTMRQVVVDYARSRMAVKRGSGQIMASFDEEGVIDLAQPESMVAIDDALRWLEQRDPRLGELVHLRVFVGMPLSEIATLMDLTPRQLQRDWQRARAWLTEALMQGGQA